jgi:hypothetical protein
MFTVTATETLFVDRFNTDPFYPNWDVAPDGQHFVMLEPLDTVERSCSCETGRARSAPS